MIEFRKACVGDALTIIKTRQKCWDATYQGIYPDEVIDRFDYEWHLKAEQNRLSSPNFHCWTVMEGGYCVGYVSCGPVRDSRFRLHSLYLLTQYQKRGLGRRMFDLVKKFCTEAGYSEMYLDCHPENHNALAFYQHMGGIITDIDAGHENKQEDTCTIEYQFCVQSEGNITQPPALLKYEGVSKCLPRPQ